MDKIKASDYIVEFLIKKGITDVFGYPGGMVTHLMDSLDKYSHSIRTHLNYHEQASAMAACGWAEMMGKPGVAYATSGPGATNLLTGIACAYYDSIPSIFLTGQVNTYEQKTYQGGRQKGFQETDIVSMATPITKMAKMVKSADDLPKTLELAYQTAMEGRRGPVLLDIPMNVSREYILKGRISEVVEQTQESNGSCAKLDKSVDRILEKLQKSYRPVLLAGHGVALSNMQGVFRQLVDTLQIPVVSSMIAVDVLPSSSVYSYGMIGAYGVRWANYILNHSDCILSLGSRLDCRQTGVNTNLFAPDASLLRIDIDSGEFENQISEKEEQFCFDLSSFLPKLLKNAKNYTWNYRAWNNACNSVRTLLRQAETLEEGNNAIREISEVIPGGTCVTTDVGQNQVWVAQSFKVKEQQRLLFCGGHGAMGYSLPSAIGAALASGKMTVAIMGDGGLQMNLQELEFVAREQLPIKIIVINNQALGMIHHFQEMYFGSNYVQTDDKKGYTVPDCMQIAQAYGLRNVQYQSADQISQYFKDDKPVVIEVRISQQTHVFPKLGMNKPIDDQEPPLSDDLRKRIIDILKEA